MTALSEQRLRALVMFMAASKESLNGYYGKVFEGGCRSNNNQHY